MHDSPERLFHSLHPTKLELTTTRLIVKTTHKLKLVFFVSFDVYLELGLSVLDDELDGDLQAFEASGEFGDIITNFFGRLGSSYGKGSI